VIKKVELNKRLNSYKNCVYKVCKVGRLIGLEVFKVEQLEG